MAEVISVLLSFPLLVTVIGLISFKSNLNSSQIRILLPSLLLLEFLIPSLALYQLLKSHEVSAWDLPKRRERYILIGLFLLVSMISLVLVFYLGNARLFKFLLSLFFLSVVISFITLFYKISLHVSLVTVFAILLNVFFDWNLTYLFLLIPLVAWARYHLQKHTPGQLAAGFLVSSVFTLGSFYILHLI